MATFSVLREVDAAAGPVAGLALEVADLGAADLRACLNAPDILDLARVMPTRLIAPEPLDDIRPDEAVPGWGLKAIGAGAGRWTGTGVRVAVLDTGVSAAHPAFAGVTLAQRDIAGSGNDDAHGHGTHFAGCILGRPVDGRPVGAAPGVTEALIAKVLPDSGPGRSDMLFDGLLWAAVERARVVAFALAFDTPALARALVTEEDLPELLAASVALEAYNANLRLMERLLARLQAAGGPVVVAAAGNDSRRTVSPDFETGVPAPASARGVLSVAALTEVAPGLVTAPFSNTGARIAAPGSGIVSAAPGGGLVALNGTSSAAGLAAGTAALWWEALAGQGADAAMVADHMMRHARGGKSASLDWGAGLVTAPPR